MANARRTLPEAVSDWDREANRAWMAEWEQERAETVSRFPLAAWPTMPIERYALGTEHSSESFCYWMEFHAFRFASIGGGTARKHLLYKRANATGWFFYPPYKDEHEAWDAIRSGFVKAFDLAANRDLLGIGEIQAIAGAPALVAKSVFTYFPSLIIPIFSHAHQQHFWELLGGVGTVPFSAPGAYRLLALAHEHPEFAGWAPMEIERFLYFWADPRQANRIVKIAPGHDGELWSDCRKNGYIRVGWDEVGDLRDFASKEEFRARFGEVFSDLYKGNQAKLSEKANEVWTLVELEPGDLVVANKGTSHVFAVGTVVDPGYERIGTLSDYGQTVHVTWDESQARDIDPIRRWAFKTVAPVSQAEYQRILSGRTPAGRKTELPDAPPDPIFTEIDGALKRKGQAILYGPPGTGKTYTARRFSVWWLAKQGGLADIGRLLSDRDAFTREERELSPDASASSLQSAPTETIGPLTRVTFHPSYTYEDFVEGYKPVPSASGQLQLRLVDGVFKRVCHAAQAKPDQAFLVLVDEINRGNIPKIFGELITLLELDKRGLTVVLPQSHETFSVPPNVYLLGTMNTADRSIKLLDAALRRRFAFIELMPDTRLLEGTRIGGLDIALFLAELNRRVARVEGREKQVGHSFLMDGDQPISDAEVFAARFRHEILPLLQEYAYEDYRELVTYLGPVLIDAEEQRVNPEKLVDAQELIAALLHEFQPTAPGAVEPELA